MTLKWLSKVTPYSKNQTGMVRVSYVFLVTLSGTDVKCRNSITKSTLVLCWQQLGLLTTCVLSSSWVKSQPAERICSDQSLFSYRGCHIYVKVDNCLFSIGVNWGQLTKDVSLTHFCMSIVLNTIYFILLGVFICIWRLLFNTRYEKNKQRLIGIMY